MKNLWKQLGSSLMISAAPALMGIAAGDTAPDFSARNQDGKTVKLLRTEGQVCAPVFSSRRRDAGLYQGGLHFSRSL